MFETSFLFILFKLKLILKHIFKIHKFNKILVFDLKNNEKKIWTNLAIT
jgi:hypothetical protein